MRERSLMRNLKLFVLVLFFLSNILLAMNNSEVVSEVKQAQAALRTHFSQPENHERHKDYMLLLEHHKQQLEVVRNAMQSQLDSLLSRKDHIDNVVHHADEIMLNSSTASADYLFKAINRSRSIFDILSGASVAVGSWFGYQAWKQSSMSLAGLSMLGYLGSISMQGAKVWVSQPVAQKDRNKLNSISWKKIGASIGVTVVGINAPDKIAKLFSKK